MGNLDLEKFIDKQRAGWNDVAEGWDRWDAWIDECLAPVDHEIVSLSEAKSGFDTLDIGSGTGYPAVRVAETVGSDGSVVGIDLSDNMLNVARKRAVSKGFDHLNFQTCDARILPFEDEKFNTVTSRFCFMFIPDLDSTIAETYRVLKDGGCVAAAVWASADKNHSLSMPVKIMQEYPEVPSPPPPPAPGIFSLGASGELAGRMKLAGFSDIKESYVHMMWEYPSSKDYFKRLMDMAAPMRGMLSMLPPAKQAEAKEKIIDTAEKFATDGVLKVPGVALVVKARK
ncbi:3-demethylubiquinone-9 3-methyltransferase [hydrothermal vent metagenome]|uniref:3-demethylubiquinone-9 3-methyltransferase n=1 Tax=hydrothermal vent metagenome TaxID=652676 RepID=A0A3B1C023_9ZZZZ